VIRAAVLLALAALAATPALAGDFTMPPGDWQCLAVQRVCGSGK
jgi:hypothetical protein